MTARYYEPSRVLAKGKYITRSGAKVKILTTTARGRYPVVGLIEIHHNLGIEDMVATWSLTGIFNQNFSEGKHQLDLVEVHEDAPL